MSKPYTITVFTLFTIAFSACDSKQQAHKRGTIVMGDSSTIVTETEPQYLQDNVQDFVLVPNTDTNTPKATIPADTVASRTDSSINRQPAKEDAGSTNAQGIRAPFEGLDISLSGVTGKLGANVDWHKSRGAAYTLTSGNLDNTTLNIKGPKQVSVEQRTETMLMIDDGSGKEVLSTMPGIMSDWKTLKADGKNNYNIRDLGNKDLVYEEKINTSKLQKAVQRYVRQHGMSKKEQQELLRKIKTAKSYKQSPLSVVVSTVIWRITYTNNKGQDITRELRIDVPH